MVASILQVKSEISLYYYNDKCEKTQTLQSSNKFKVRLLTMSLWADVYSVDATNSRQLRT